MEEPNLTESYLNCANTNGRLELLNRLRETQQSLPLSLSADLMKLKLNPDEHISILRCISSKQKLSLEDYLSSQLSSWDQNVAAAALWEWALRTDCILGHRALPLSLSALTSQRIRYTLLDLAWFLGGLNLIKKLAQMDGLDDMSPAFHSLLCFRALQFNVVSDSLLNRAKSAIEQSLSLALPSEKTIPYFIAYIFRFDPQWAKSRLINQGFPGIWTQFLHAHQESNRWKQEVDTLKKVLNTDSKIFDESQILANWPSIWDRHNIDAHVLNLIFNALVEQKLPTVSTQSWEFFAGISPSNLQIFLLQCEAPKVLCLGINILAPFLDNDQQSAVLERFKSVLQRADNPSEILGLLSPRYSALLNQSGTQSIFSKISEERLRTISAFERNECIETKGLQIWEKEFSTQDLSRHNFFSLAYFGRKTNEVRGDDFWSELAIAWQNPRSERLEIISQKARQSPSLYQICYIDTLGRFKGNDTAALKILDFIRSGEEPILRSVIHALAGIGTLRATQELVAFLTRPNVSPHLQIEISQILKEIDVKNLQAELRSALNDLNYRTLTDTVLIELRDAISSLLTVNEVPQAVQTDNQNQSPTTTDLDRMLLQKIASYEQLSSEVKRALRTAQFFQLQVEQAGRKLDTIDLSPAIDMQYKALELCFREKFEQTCGDIIRRGVLQRKLDVIGYARPIPQAMDAFESYIEGLPIINSIPFFSRFKLRKMLRAICQYRPGKRFTLDGLKAFAIFFICFSRSECRFGLGKIFPITKMSQDQMLLFCKELHVFQDFRNRAAHEGFHPDASSDLDSIWRSTASIIQNMVLISEDIESSAKPINLKKIG